MAPSDETSFLHLSQMNAMGPNEITIAITVYDRKKYIGEAIRSALALRVNEWPKIIVVEDCGPNPRLREEILNEFDGQIEYVRNPKRLGLFGNWNACIEACQTPWLCILHDDDSLEPTFIESMIELSNAAPERALYYGRCNVVDGEGNMIEKADRPEVFSWHELPLEDWARYDPVCFPGQLFKVEAARSVGGFRAASHYSADWEMWFKLALNYGAAATNRVVANYREHHSIGRGTTAVDVSGRKYACGNMQRKRHMAWLRQKKIDLRFDRRALLKEAPMSTRFLLQHGCAFSPRMLRYNAGLLYLSSSPHFGYRIFQFAVRLFSWRSVRPASLFFCWAKNKALPSN